MSKLTNSEIKILRLLDKHVGTPDKDRTVKFLRDTLAFNHTDSLDWWKLWYLNKETQETPYEQMENINRGFSFLVDAIKEIISNEEFSPMVMVDKMYDEDIEKYEKIIGPYFRESGKDITFDSEGVQLHLPREEWAEYFSGMGDDDIWRYEGAKNHYGAQDDENFEYEEFDYINPNEELFDAFNELGEAVGDNRKWSVDNRPNDTDVTDWLYSNLTREDAEDIIQEYLWSLGTAVTRARNNELLAWYEEKVDYPESRCDSYSDDECITIPYEDLLLMIKENEWITLSQLKDAGLNDGVENIADAYYDSWLDDEGYEEVMTHTRDTVENIITKIEDDEDYMVPITKRKEFLKLLEKFKFKEGSYDWKCKDSSYVSENGKIRVCVRDYDAQNEKVKFFYDGEAHLTPLNDFIAWAQGSILELSENIRIGKYRLIMESIASDAEITKIAIFDFDGTLMNTPQAEEGKKQWEIKTGKPYPHIGWWGRQESLDTDVFNIKPIVSTILDYNIEIDDPNTLVIMLTGRLPKQAPQVENILNDYNIVFDEYHYKEDGDTLKSKINTIKSLLLRYPNVNFIEMYEDRVPHAIAFEEWGEENNIPIKVNVVTPS